MTTPISRALADAREKVEAALTGAASPDETRRWQRCRNYLDTISVREPRAFVSYHKTDGAAYYETLKAAFEKRKFEAVSGFDVIPGEVIVADKVLHRLRTSAVYVGILTPDVPTADGRGAPSIWTLEERGMAIALKKPFVLMVHHKVHSSFVSTSRGYLHHRFTEQDFAQKVQETLNDVIRLYTDLDHT